MIAAAGRGIAPGGLPRKWPTILEVRHAHPDYGAEKIAWFLERHRPELDPTSRTTIYSLLLRHGFVPKRRRRVRRWHPGRPTAEATAPNVIWTADYKGQFRTRNGQYCFPLTVQDMHSRFLLGCQGLPDTSIARARPVFVRLFRETASPSESAPTTALPSAPTLSVGCPGSPSGSYA